MKKLTLILWALSCTALLSAQTVDWPEVKTEAKPGARWWWMGSAVDEENLTRNIERYAAAGMGSLEVTPIYGVQHNESREINFLSTRWMEVLRHTESETARLGMLTDMNTGTGWPFGGPEVSIEDAASKLIIEEYTLADGASLEQKVEVTDEKQKPYAKLERLMAYKVTPTNAKARIEDLTDKVDADGTLNWKAPKGEWRLIAAFCGKTLQKVKRAAPGGEGYVLNHLSYDAVSRYLARFDKAFAGQTDKADGRTTDMPHNFFNDSYEVYGADWTPGFFDEFEFRRGYKLENYLPEFLTPDDERDDAARRVVSDYRETMGELLLENFTQQWTDWAHGHGSLTRNQAHGSPGNLIDLYGTVDVPEIEGFGLSDFDIKGLRKDSISKKNDSDLSMLKYAPSAAHISGKPLTSSETFTWLTEHFRTSLSQCKPDIDLMFVSGVNHVFFHGTTYSPDDAAWPGWKFYASIDMSPTNNIWRDAKAFFSYITRCQSFLQYGQPDNDFLVYLPVYDMWYEQGGRLLMFDIHGMAHRAPQFIEAVNRIYQAGFDMDYVSDNFIRSATVADGRIVTSGGTAYKAIVIPGARFMPIDVLAKLLNMAQLGATVVFLDSYPESQPGLNVDDAARKAYQAILYGLKEFEGKNVIYGTDYAATLASTPAVAEPMKSVYGLSSIRRVNDDGHHYFISALTDKDTEGWIPLSVNAQSAMLYDPMDGRSGKAALRQHDGRTEVYLQLPSGASIIVKTFDDADVPADAWAYARPSTTATPVSLPETWGFSMVEATPEVSQVPDSVAIGSWTDFGFEGATVTMGAGCYSTSFTIDDPSSAADWLLTLGDVRESARVRINGQEVTTLWAVPYSVRIGQYLRRGLNTLEVEVTNLPANRISEMDRQGVVWRIFKDTNIVKLGYLKGDFADWGPVPSGLLGPVSIVPMETVAP